MAWTTTAPSTGDIAVENGKVRDNWGIIKTTVDVDHYGMSEPANVNDGEHKQVTLVEIATAPTGVASKGFVYGYPDATSSETEVFAKGKNDTPVQITRDGEIAGGGLVSAAWGSFNGSSLTASAGCTASYNGTTFTATFTHEMATANYVVNFNFPQLAAAVNKQVNKSTTGFNISRNASVTWNGIIDFSVFGTLA